MIKLIFVLRFHSRDTGVYILRIGLEIRVWKRIS